jgi:lipopolysaccharide export system permease protein
MLFKKQLRWEISNTTGAIFLVLLTVVFIFMMLRALASVNSGQISPQDILLLMSLSSVMYIPHIIIGSLFIATIMVLTRWYETSEMVVWQSSGLPLIRFLMPIWNVSLPFFVLIAGLSLFLWPWSNSYIEQLKQNFKQRDEISLLVSGQFFELDKSNKVLFIENLDTSKAKQKCKNLYGQELTKCEAQNSEISGIFATGIDVENINNNKSSIQSLMSIDIMSAKHGYMLEQNSGKQAQLINGERYIIKSDKQNYQDTKNYQAQNISFEELKIKLKPSINNMAENASNYPTRALSTQYLWNNKTKDNLIELGWRIAMPFSLLILQLWALVLAHANPRKGKYFNIVLSIVVYIVYNNMIGISQVWMEKEKISVVLGTSIIHIMLLISGVLLLVYRTYGFYGLCSLCGLRGLIKIKK